MAKAKSIWPNDLYPDQVLKISEQSIEQVTCFVISPISDDKARWDDLLSLITHVCDRIAKNLAISIEVLRADHIVSAGIIHPEIWQRIIASDLIIADISGLNGNVMLELGVAAAWRQKENVIILREANPEEKLLFDINPARHIEYSHSFGGLEKLKADLFKLIHEALTAAPLQPLEKLSVDLPFKMDFSNGRDCHILRFLYPQA